MLFQLSDCYGKVQCLFATARDFWPSTCCTLSFIAFLSRLLVRSVPPRFCAALDKRFPPECYGALRCYFFPFLGITRALHKNWKKKERKRKPSQISSPLSFWQAGEHLLRIPELRSVRPSVHDVPCVFFLSGRFYQGERVDVPGFVCYGRFPTIVLRNS